MHASKCPLRDSASLVPLMALMQVAEEAASKAKGGAQQTYRTATEYGSAAYDMVGC